MTSATPRKKSTIETEAFLSGKLAQVDVARIERELKELWTAAARMKTEDQAEERQIANVMRACTANVIVFSNDEDAELTASNALDEVALRHPSRAILAISRPSEKENLEAWVSARCHLVDAKSLKQICSEQITVRYEGPGGTRELASVVEPLALPDLPVLVWWRVGDLSLEHLDPFLVFADRLVVDSGMAKEIDAYFHSLERLFETRKDTVISDLSWDWIQQWRRTAANAFSGENAPLPVSALSSITRMKINYACCHATSKTDVEGRLAQPILFASWFASRLGWTVSKFETKEQKAGVEFKAGSRKVDVEFIPIPVSRMRNGAIVGVSIDVTEPAEKTLVIKKSPDAPVLTVSLGAFDSSPTVTDGRCEETDAFFTRLEASLVDIELELLPRDQILEETMTMVGRMVRKLERK